MSISRAFIGAMVAGVTILISGCGGGDAPNTPQPARQALRAPTAAAVTDANRLMDFAETNFGSVFGGTRTSGTLGGIMWRHYTTVGGIYLGVVVDTQAGLQTGGVYVLGGPWTGLTYVGPVSSFITPTSTGGTTGNRTLVVTVTAAGVNQTITVGNVPAPTTQVDFCNGLTADTTFTQIAAGAGGSLTINSCTFNGTSGSISATLVITSPVSLTFPYTITYTYQ